MARLAERARRGSLGDTTPAFTCSDGLTKLPFEVMGELELSTSRLNFVVCHDVFDTHEATRTLFKPLVEKHMGCQVLVFNYGAQAHCRYPVPTPEEAKHQSPADASLNNEWCSDRLAELMAYLEATGAMLFSAPFHLVGIGSGLPLAAAFAAKHGRLPRYRRSLRSLVSINGFCSVDPQLAAVLHSAKKVFGSFPENRPDLPVSYWTKFLFSEEYMGRVHPHLALNMYTAVANPLTLEGRIKQCNAVLATQDVSQRVQPQELPVPVVVLQSTENALVSGANVDSLVEGRAASHLWSHQLALDETRPGKSSLTRAGVGMLTEALNKAQGAMVVWVRAGHEVRQERKRVISDLFEALVLPSRPAEEELAGLPQPEPQWLAAYERKGETGVGQEEGGGERSGHFVPSQELVTAISQSASKASLPHTPAVPGAGEGEAGDVPPSSSSDSGGSRSSDADEDPRGVFM